MPAETDADRQLFMAPDDWAVPVAWMHSAGTANFHAIFDADYQLTGSEFLGGGVEGSSPQIHACSADIPAACLQGDSVTVNSRSFTVVEIKPDGTGMTVVRLQEV